MKIPKNVLNKAWKIVLLPALIAIVGSVANQLKDLEPQLQKETIGSSNVYQSTNDSNYSPSIVGDDTEINYEVNNSSETNGEKTEIGEQTNSETEIENQQNNENNGNGITNCIDNNAPCGNSGTNIFN